MTENKTPNPNEALIHEVLELMNLSSMSQDERTMWTILLPSLTTEEIQKFKATLEKEVRTMTDIYLRAQTELAKDNKK